MICVANFDTETTRFILDPDYVDHMLIGDENFQYNKEHVEKKNYRKEAISKNRKLLIGTSSVKKRLEWFNGLKIGDSYWCGETFDELCKNKFTVVDIKDVSCPRHILEDIPVFIKAQSPSHRSIVVRANGGQWDQTETQDHFSWRKVTDKEPFQLSDPMCGQVR